jgi:multicomponent Na+:H+ antiporter subunit B
VQIFSLVFNLDVIILFLMLLVAVAVIAAKDLVTSTILLAIFSLLMAAEYLVMSAVDVAITEAAVGAGISTILLLLALFLVGAKEKKASGEYFIVPIIAVALVALALVYTSFEMPAYGNKAAPAQMHIAPYYLQNAGAETGVPNVVAAVLASYRGYDTMGETTVIFAAAVAVMLLLAKFKKTDGE